MTYAIFRANLKALMESRGYTAKSLAEELNFVPSTVSRYLTGIRQPDLPYVLKIAEHFNVSIDWLMGNCGEKYDVLPEEYQRLIRLYSVATVSDRNVINVLLSKYADD